MKHELGPLPDYAHAFRPRWHGDDGGFTSVQMRTYAAAEVARAVAAERERCAKVCESEPERKRGDGIFAADQKACAEAIRKLT